MATMVWCQSCRTVVWAYDHHTSDLRGICNLLRLPCPKCGKEGNFDGWSSDHAVEAASGSLGGSKKVYDDWSAMKTVANIHGVKWDPSPDNRWFPSQ